MSTIEYSLEEIVQLTGISTNKAEEVCQALCSGGFLIYSKENGKYKITGDNDRLKEILKAKEQLENDSTARQVRSKIEDILLFGKPLALSESVEKPCPKSIGIPGMDIIFHDSNMEGKPVPNTIGGIPRGHCILVKGAPGTGKTTMGMQIAVHLKEQDYGVLFLTFEEGIEQLYRNLEVYFKEPDSDIGWNKKIIGAVTRSISRIQTSSTWENPEKVLEEICGILDNEMPQVVLLDSVSRFRDVGGEEKARLVVRNLIRILKMRHITSFFLGEDSGESHSFEEYEADGILHLKWLEDQLSLEVKKMRGRRTYKGPHSAAFLTVKELCRGPETRFLSKEYTPKRNEENYGAVPYLKPGFNVFPEISVFKDRKVREKTEIQKPVDTGTKGLNQLLPFTAPSNKEGFRKGETILIIGSAGAGKTLLALNFMRAGYDKRDENEDKKIKLGVWINLEGELGTLQFATEGFKGDLEDIKNLKKMVESADPDHKDYKDDNYFKFFSFPPINLDLNKIVYTLETIFQNKKYKIDRLVIDSITELERARGGGQPEVKAFLAGLIQFLRDRNITTMFISRSDTFFRSIDKIEEQISSLVDLIICIRNFDMHNQITKGVYIQKARGRAHNSKIMRMTIDPFQGIQITDSGWDVENLLAGDTSNIQGPRVFFKLFYENFAEKEINDEIILDFDKERYPGDEPIFKAVKKTSIHTEFWSFKGQYGAGHANTRVLSIADHVISAFRDNNRLESLANYVKRELLQNIRKEEHLLRLYNPGKASESTPDSKNEKPSANDKEKDTRPPEPEEYIINAIPIYRDYGVMVFTPSLVEKDERKQRTIEFLVRFSEHSSKMTNKEEYDDSWWYKSKKAAYTWENLLELIGDFEKNKKKPGVYAFAFPSLESRSEFIAFFLELLWSHGGDIYDIPIGMEYESSGYRKRFKDIIKGHIIYDLCECKNYFLKSYTSESGEDNIDDSIEEILKCLFKENSDENQQKIYKQIKKRFKEYNIGQGHVEFDDLLKFAKKLVPEGDDQQNEFGVIKCSNDDDSFKDTIKLIMRLIHKAGVPNPIHGDFKNRALLSRHWYSQLYKKPTKFRGLLPLPLAEIQVNDEDKSIYYYRSVTCTTYWSLVMLQNALSPEIGGNFIESMNAPTYYTKRLRMRAGMPTMDWELDKEEFIEYDKESYSILNRTMDNGRMNEKLNKQISEWLKIESTGDEMQKKQAGKDFEDFLKDNDYPLIGTRPLKIISQKDKDRFDISKAISKDLKTGPKASLKRIFYPKSRQTRVAFYQLEHAIHFQLRQLLIPDPEKEKVPFLSGIHNEIRDVCLEEVDSNNSQDSETKWNEIFEKITNELRLHIILELLVYFYREDEGTKR